MDNQFTQPNQLTQCGKFWSFSWLLRLPSVLTKGELSGQTRQFVHRARWAALAGLHAVDTNRRIYLGLFLILVVAPLSGATYQLFDITAVDRSWYFRTYFDFFLVLCPNICLCFSFVGASLLFPQDSHKAYFLLPPLTLYVTKILWLCIVVKSNDEFNGFWQIIPYYFFITGGIVAFTLIYTFNFLMTLHFHKREGHIARIIGIIQAPGIAPAKQVEIARKEIARLQEFKSKY